MPSFCAVIGCSNRHNREKDRSYYRLPKVIKHQGEKTLELSQTRRLKWLENIGRSDLQPSSLDNIRICSDHFSNKPAALYDNLNPDWVPTVKMDLTPKLLTPVRGRRRCKQPMEKSARKELYAAATTLLDLQFDAQTERDDCNTSVASQTTVDMAMYSAMESELQKLRQENVSLKRAVSDANRRTQVVYVIPPGISTPDCSIEEVPDDGVKCRLHEMLPVQT